VRQISTLAAALAVLSGPVLADDDSMCAGLRKAVDAAFNDGVLLCGKDPQGETPLDTSPYSPQTFENAMYWRILAETFKSRCPEHAGIETAAKLGELTPEQWKEQHAIFDECEQMSVEKGV
jgi:hypothetical protein